MKIGDQVPTFTLPDDSGNNITLDGLLKQGMVVLYFYPKDNTPGCTLEAKAFRDSYEDFTDAGAQVVGVSSDSIESHCGFRDKHNLPFTLLSDHKGTVARQYGISRTLGFIPGRETFIIGKDGILLHTFKSQFNAQKHVAEALQFLKAG